MAAVNIYLKLNNSIILSTWLEASENAMFMHKVCIWIWLILLIICEMVVYACAPPRVEEMICVLPKGLRRWYVCSPKGWGDDLRAPRGVEVMILRWYSSCMSGGRMKILIMNATCESYVTWLADFLIVLNHYLLNELMIVSFDIVYAGWLECYYWITVVLLIVL